jgi:cell wall-associated NlpC family hydrolase
VRDVVRAAILAAAIAITILSLPAPAPSAGAATAATAALTARAGHPPEGSGHVAAKRLPAAVRLRLRAWRWALRQQGKPYIWGGTGPYGFDCSGLVYAAYRTAGLLLPRTTYEMLDSWHLVRIPKRLARRGDLAFFGTGHVELYGWGRWTFGAETTGTLIGFHRMNAYWHPTMYFRIRI